MQDQEFTAARLRIELLAGLTVALALVPPQAVAFSFVAGVHPLVGLYAAFLVGLITAILGGRPGMISGATGALAVVIFLAQLGQFKVPRRMGKHRPWHVGGRMALERAALYHAGAGGADRGSDPGHAAAGPRGAGAPGGHR